MIVGIDFDNTIVCYDLVFYVAARELELIPETLPQNKQVIRDYLRSKNKEESWTKLQGYVYGSKMLDAVPFPEAIRFLRLAEKHGYDWHIISHKTNKPSSGEHYDLHAAAYQWLEKSDILRSNGPRSTRARIHFEPTREAKIARITACGCDCFIDDLPEVLEDSQFPGHVRRILFDPAGLHDDSNLYHRVADWRALIDLFF